MLRMIPLVVILGATAACSGASSSPERDDGPLEVASQTAALAAPLAPAFVAGGMTACPDIAGAGGAWLAKRGAWKVCHDLRLWDVDGCGYDWSSSAGDPHDIDALAVGVGPSVSRLLPAGTSASPGVIAHCASMHHPNPGSTPCGACQVGVATATHVYLSLGAPFEEDTTLGLRSDVSTVVVHVPAHTLRVTQPMTLSSAFGAGVSLYVNGDD